MSWAEQARRIIKPGEDNGSLPERDGPVKMVCMQRRKPGLTWEEFDHHWGTVHAGHVASVAKSMGFTRYVQTPAYRHPLIDSFKAARGWTGEYDGLTEVWYESYAAMVKALESPEAAEANKVLVADEVTFCDAESLICFLSYERVVF